MSSDTPPIPVTPWYKQPWFTHIAAMLVTFALNLLVWYLAGRQGPPPAPPVIDPDDLPVIQERGYTTGWRRDDESAKAFQSTLRFPTFAATPAGQQDVPADLNVFLWEAVREAWQKYDGPAKTDAPYPNVDQADTGECVGAGTKHVEDTVTAVLQEIEHIITGWEPIAVEAIYAEGRVDIGRGQLRGDDGSNGSWSAQAAKQYGNLLMRKYGQYDLTHYDPHRTRQWGDSGVPKALKAEARKYLIGSVTKVNSCDDCRKALAQRYPIILCCSVGFNKPGTRPGYINPGTRDKDGFVKANGRWDHCMGLIGMQGGSRPGGFIINSWGDEAHKGPVGKGNPPVCGFWADPATIDRMCKQSGSECYAFSGIDGFPARKPLGWDDITRAERNARRVFDMPFALAP